MAIQEIEISKIQGDSGFKRTINENSMNLVLDTIQITQYVKPEESTVRELTANAVDSQLEKEKAIKILRGEAKVEDYYIERNDPKYKDSNWDASYYDLKAFDVINNRVKLTYIEGQGTGFCDKFIVRDHGVGLGEKRLEGYFEIGYSSKRNSKDQLGAFGFGNKVALTTRCDYYTVETVHNGRKFKFNCYSYKIDSLIGKFNTTTGQLNKSMTFKSGATVYYEDTTEKNYAEITVPVKRHNRQKYIQAVKAQLLYFNNVDFVVHQEDGGEYSVQFEAEVLYSSDNIILSDNKQFSKPHIVIVKGDGANNTTGVCYGYIDFLEMEMQEIGGNIGVKCPIRSVITDEYGNETLLQEGVSVTPSRESVIWDEHTREFVKNRFEKVVDEATTIVEKQLEEKDFIKWLDKCAQVIAGYNGDTVLGRLKKVIDTSQLKPKFPGNKNIAYKHPGDLFWGLNPRIITTKWDYKTSKDIVERETIKSWSNFNSKYFYLQSEDSDRYKDIFVIKNMHHSFVTVRVEDKESLRKNFNEYYQTSGLTKEQKEKLFESKLANRDTVLQLIKASAMYATYEDIKVDEAWLTRYKSNEKTGDANVTAKVVLTPAEKRELENRTVANALYAFDWSGADRLFSRHKVEPKVKEILNDDAEIYYGFQEDEEKLHIAGYITGKTESGGTDRRNQFLYNNNFKLMLVSKSNEKYYNNRMHIDEFFPYILNDEIKMSKQMVRWVTAERINEQLKKLEFLTNYATFSPEAAKLYKELKSYAKANGPTWDNQNVNYGATRDAMKQLKEQASKIVDFQLFVLDHEGSTDAIANKALELFGEDGKHVRKAVGVDLELQLKLDKLVQYADPVYELFNQINCLVNEEKIPYNAELILREIIDLKGLTDYEFTEPDKELEDDQQLADSEYSGGSGNLPTNTDTGT